MTKKNAAAQALRAIPSRKRAQASRLNGQHGGRPRTKPPRDPETVLAHADDTISYWHAAQHRWCSHVATVSTGDLMKLPSRQRSMILKLLGPRG